MADAVRASALVVCIDPAGVRVPAVAATKMDVGRPPTEGGLMLHQDLSGRPAHDS